MPYTLVKFLLWFGLAAVVGVAIGWALRSLRARAELSARRGTQIDAEELGRLRGQRDNLDEVLAERDRLRALVAELQTSMTDDVVASTAPTQAARAGAGTRAGQDIGLRAGPDGSPDDSQDVGPDDSQDVGPDDSQDVGPDDSQDGAAADESDVARRNTGTPFDAGSAPRSAAAGDDGDPRPLDAAAAASVIGRAIEIDDLTVVEGIGPKIAELCRGIGITTWHDLANTSVDELRSMLHDAGSRYQVHRPDTWPAQASLLARGAWVEFVAFTDDLGSRI